MDLIIAGIDYSMSSPAMCVHTGDEWSYDNCKFYSYSTKKRPLVDDTGKYSMKTIPDWEHPQERFYNLASYFMEIIDDVIPTKVVLEGYSFGSTGKVFNIAENAGMLKYFVWEGFYPLEISPPTVIKKFATGNGQAKKAVMYESFLKDTGDDISTRFGMIAHGNPISDYVDSYWICKYGFEQEQIK